MVLHHLLGGKNAGSRVRRSKRIRRRSTRSQILALRPRFEVMEDRTLLATMLWANSANGDWNVAANWVNQANSSDHHVPTSADDAQINFSGISVSYASGSGSVNSLTSQANLDLSSGSLSITTTSSISGGFTMSGGTFSPASILTVSGPMTWTGGTINGGGTLTAQGTLSLGNATAFVSESLSGATLNNAGSATLAGKNSIINYGLLLASGATFDNLPGASFTFQTDAEIFGTGSSTTFKNEGTLTKAGGTATSPISTVFNQTATGSLHVQSGTLQLSGGTFAGTVQATGGGSLTMTTAPTNLASGTLTGATWLVGAKGIPGE